MYRLILIIGIISFPFLSFAQQVYPQVYPQTLQGWWAGGSAIGHVDLNTYRLYGDLSADPNTYLVWDSGGDAFDLELGGVTLNLSESTDIILTSDAGLQLLTSSNSDILFLPNGTGESSFTDHLVNIGDGSYAPTGSPTSLFAEGSIEIDGASRFDGQVTTTAAVNIQGDMNQSDTKYFAMGGNDVNAFLFLGDETEAQMLFLTGDHSGNHIVIGNANHNAKDYDRPLATDPTLWIFSDTDPDSANDQYVGIYHDQTNANIDVGTGTLNILDEVMFMNNAAAVTFGDVTTDADVVLAFDAVTNQGSITYKEDEDRFDFDNTINVDAITTSNNNGAVNIGTTGYIYFNSDTLIKGDTTNTQFLMLTDDGQGNQINIGNKAFWNNVDFGLATTTNPTLAIWSDLDPSGAGATLYGTLAHDQTDFVITSGAGDIKLSPAQNINGNDANVTNIGDINVDTVNADDTTVNYMDVDLLEIAQADLDATCTANQIRLDTGGATAELCFCQATDTWYCIAIDDTTGPAD